MRREIGNRPATRIGPDRLAALVGAGAALAAPALGVLYGVIRVGYEEYYRELDLTPDDVGLSQAAIVSGIAVVVGALIAVAATWVAFGIAVFRLIAPIRAAKADAERSRRDWLRLLLVVLVGAGVAIIPLVAAIGLGGGHWSVLWATGAYLGGMMAIALSWVFADVELNITNRCRQAWSALYAGSPPRVRLLFEIAAGGGALVVLVLSFWSDSGAAGRAVYERGQLPEEVVPARSGGAGAGDTERWRRARSLRRVAHGAARGTRRRRVVRAVSRPGWRSTARGRSPRTQ